MFANYIAIKEIEIRPCLYDAVCSARRCQAKATVIARAFDSGGRPAKQYELCSQHGLHMAEREKRKGRGVLFLLD
jgi:hypothetical protein